jgi:haloacetate dehalogenase
MASSRLFPGFTARTVQVGDAGEDIAIHCEFGGAGPALLLLHGYPQTHCIWHKVAQQLSRHYTVVCADLRGYGDSSKPPGLRDHGNYSKRVMARDQVRLMRALGHERFVVVGHDRGGRVAHRMARDHRGVIEKICVLDICPTLTMYENTTMAFAQAYYHWFFLIQPAPFPETLIGHDPRYYLPWTSGGRHGNSNAFTDSAAIAEYERCFSTPEAIHASCEDYRASASIDLDHDRTDLAEKIDCPLLVLWGERGVVNRLFHPLKDWSEVATHVRGKALPSGHFIPKEVPALLLDELLPFLAEK